MKKEIFIVMPVGNEEDTMADTLNRILKLDNRKIISLEKYHF